MMCQLLNVVHQTVELPLRIHFLLPSEGEAVELLVVADVAEHRFHRGKAASVFRLPFGAVDACLHLVGEAWLAVGLAMEETYLPGLGLFRGAQTFVSLFARHVVLLRALKLDGCESIDDAVAAVAVKRLARRADAGMRVCVVLKVFGAIDGCLFLCFLVA